LVYIPHNYGEKRAGATVQKIYFGDAILMLAEAADPAEVARCQSKELANRLETCINTLDHWRHDNDFWECLATKDMTSQLIGPVTRYLGGAEMRAGMALAMLPPLSDQSGRARNSVSLMMTYLGYNFNQDLIMSLELDPGMTLTMLNLLFRAASGGLVIVGALVDEGVTLGVSAGAVSVGLTAIIKASAEMAKVVKAKFPKPPLGILPPFSM